MNNKIWNKSQIGNYAQRQLKHLTRYAKAHHIASTRYSKHPLSHKDATVISKIDNLNSIYQMSTESYPIKAYSRAVQDGSFARNKVRLDMKNPGMSAKDTVERNQKLFKLSKQDYVQHANHLDLKHAQAFKPVLKNTTKNVQANYKKAGRNKGMIRGGLSELDRITRGYDRHAVNKKSRINVPHVHNKNPSIKEFIQASHKIGHQLNHVIVNHLVDRHASPAVQDEQLHQDFNKQQKALKSNRKAYRITKQLKNRGFSDPPASDYVSAKRSQKLVNYAKDKMHVSDHELKQIFPKLNHEKMPKTLTIDLNNRYRHFKTVQSINKMQSHLDTKTMGKLTKIQKRARHIDFTQKIKGKGALFDTTVGHHISDMKHEMDSGPDLLHDIIQGSPVTDKALGIKTGDMISKSKGLSHGYYKQNANKAWKPVSAKTIRNTINKQYKNYKGFQAKQSLSRGKLPKMDNSSAIAKPASSKLNRSFKVQNKKPSVSHRGVSKKRVLKAKHNRGIQR